MATIAPTITDVSATGDGSAIAVVWTPLTEADTCAPVQYPSHSAKSVQVAGTFGSASVAVQGSNDGTNYAALNTPANSAIAITTAGIKSVLESTQLVKPVATGGTSQSLTISMLLLRSSPSRS